MRLQFEQIERVIPLIKEHQEQDSRGSFNSRRVRLLLEREVDNPRTLILVNKGMTAILIFTLQENLFTAQPSLQEVCFYSRTPGSGFRLLKEAVPWIRRWGDGVLYKTFISTGSDKTNKMLERFGMKQIGVIYDMEEIL